jgi:hypothetical protein
MIIIRVGRLCTIWIPKKRAVARSLLSDHVQFFCNFLRSFCNVPHTSANGFPVPFHVYAGFNLAAAKDDVMFHNLPVQLRKSGLLHDRYPLVS